MQLKGVYEGRPHDAKVYFTALDGCSDYPHVLVGGRFHTVCGRFDWDLPI
jgi:hypothetical protein